MRGRKPALRSLQRQALAKQQAEQQQQLRQKSTLDTHKSASSSYARALTTVGPLQSYNVSVTDHFFLTTCRSSFIYVLY